MAEGNLYDKGELTNHDQTLGLDMGVTLGWYEKFGIDLPAVSESSFRYAIEHENLIGLSKGELGGLFSLFPEKARERSILRKVVGKPAAWFHRGSTDVQPKPTTDASEAKSPTAIIPSYIDYSSWKQTGVPAADIWLYQIPSDITSDRVRKVVLAEGFVHEIGHSIVQPALYIKDYNLKFPDGNICSGFDTMLQFANLAENHPPISHYSSVYRGPNNKFESTKPGYNSLTAISEEMCETIAAHLLGFAYCGDNLKGRDPFTDRSEVRDFVNNFLNAELVKKV